MTPLALDIPAPHTHKTGSVATFSWTSPATTSRIRVVHAPHWIWRNPVALADLVEGLAQSAAGETEPMGSFAEFAEVDLDD